jgi:hypothetical protein
MRFMHREGSKTGEKSRHSYSDTFGLLSKTGIISRSLLAYQVPARLGTPAGFNALMRLYIGAVGNDYDLQDACTLWMNTKEHHVS